MEHQIKVEDPIWEEAEFEPTRSVELDPPPLFHRERSIPQRQAAINFQESLLNFRRPDELVINNLYPVSIAFPGDPWDIWDVDYSNFDWSRASAGKATRSIEDKVTFGDWDKALIEYGVLVQLYRRMTKNMTVTAFLKTMPTGRSLISCESIGRVVEILLAHPVWAVRKMVSFLTYLADANFRKANSKQGKLEKLFHYLIREVFEDEDGEEVFARWYDILVYSRQPQNATKEIYLPCNSSWLYDQYKPMLSPARKQSLYLKMNQIRQDRVNGTNKIQWPTPEEVILAKEVLRTDFAEELQMIPRSSRNLTTSKIKDGKRNKFEIYDSPAPTGEENALSDEDHELSLAANTSSRNLRKRPPGLEVEPTLEPEESDLMVSQRKQQKRNCETPSGSVGSSNMAEMKEPAFKLSDPNILSALIQAGSQFSYSLIAMENQGQTLNFGKIGARQEKTLILREDSMDSSVISVAVGERAEKEAPETWDKSWPMFKYAFIGKLHILVSEM